jgi:hypothetical protein
VIYPARSKLALLMLAAAVIYAAIYAAVVS